MVTISQNGGQITLQLESLDELITLRKGLVDVLEIYAQFASNYAESSNVFEVFGLLKELQDAEIEYIKQVKEKAESYDKVSVFLSEIAKSIEFARSQNESYKDDALKLAQQNLEKLANAYKD